MSKLEYNAGSVSGALASVTTQLATAEGAAETIKKAFTELAADGSGSAMNASVEYSTTSDRAVANVRDAVTQLNLLVQRTTDDAGSLDANTAASIGG